MASKPKMNKDDDYVTLALVVAKRNAESDVAAAEVEISKAATLRLRGEDRLAEAKARIAAYQKAIDDRKESR